MTPEELETRLKSFNTPAPPGRIRDRLLNQAKAAETPRRAWHFTPALAAAAAFAFIFWLAWMPGRDSREIPAASQDDVQGLIDRLGHEDITERDKALSRLIELGTLAEAAIRKATVHKDPEIAARAVQLVGVLERQRRFGTFTKDRAFQERMESLLKANPGKALLVAQIVESRDGTLKPLKSKDYTVAVAVNGSDIKVGGHRGQSADMVFDTPDAEGRLAFVVPPGKGRIHGVNGFQSRIGEGYLTWEDCPATYDVSEVLVLPDLRYVPKIRWTSPVAGAKVGIKSGSEISWEGVAGMVRVSVTLLQIDRQGASSEVYVDAARVDRECTKDRKIRLEDLLKASKVALGPGSEVGLRITGFAADGSVVAENRELWRFFLGE